MAFELPTEDPQFSAYRRFTTAVTTDDWSDADEYVNRSEFRVYLPKREPMDLDEFIKYMRALQDMTSDFGYNALVHDARQQGTMVVVLYTIKFTFAGQQIEYTSADWAMFAGGKLVSLHVMFDIDGNQLKAFGRTLPRV